MAAFLAFLGYCDTPLFAFLFSSVATSMQDVAVMRRKSVFISRVEPNGHNFSTLGSGM
jgi:hypothetical protein